MRNIAFVLTLFVALELCAQPLPTSRAKESGFSPERLTRLGVTMQTMVDQGLHAGIVTLIARDGHLVDFHAYGYRNLEKNLPMERDTIFRIYSMSKLLTSVAVLQLIEDGRVVLDDPVAKYIPALDQVKVLTGGTADAPVLADPMRPVTVRHLLTHTSGYTYDIMSEGPLQELYNRQNLWQSSSLADFIARAGKLPLKHHPGAEFTYGISSDILGFVIETVSGQSFEHYLQEHICLPLGMKDTAFSVPTEKRSRLATLYTTGSDGKLHPMEPILETHDEPGRGFPSGGAGLFSTAGDYVRFAQMLLNGGHLEGKRILGRKLIEAMRLNHLADLSKPHHQFREAYGFGLGVEVRTSLIKGDLPGSLGQFGWYGIATTHCDIDPKERTVTIVMTQHLPFDEHGLFAKFNASFYSALE